MEEVEKFSAEMNKFSPEASDFSEPAEPILIAAFEAATQVTLPTDYKLAISRSNGFSIMGDEVYGILEKNVPLSLDSVYRREHEEVRYPQSDYLAPFSSDGGGNFYCFDSRYRTSCSVVFWVSNYQYTDTDEG